MKQVAVSVTRDSVEITIRHVLAVANQSINGVEALGEQSKSDSFRGADGWVSWWTRGTARECSPAFDCAKLLVMQEIFHRRIILQEPRGGEQA